jgi:hypothetical protein
MAEKKEKDFKSLPAKEKAILIAQGKLLKYLRAQEKAFNLTPEQAKTLIGAVKVLVSIAEGKFEAKKA